MIIQTYQSHAVLRALREGKTYYAKPSIAFKDQYAALIDMLDLNCDCPIFGVIKGRKQKTGGKVSGAVRLTLDVPSRHIHLTEYDVWADFLDAFRYSKPGDYRQVSGGSNEISGHDYAKLISDLKNQRKPGKYKAPQVVLEKIEPSWLVSSRVMPTKTGVAEKISHFFSGKETKYKRSKKKD